MKSTGTTSIFNRVPFGIVMGGCAFLILLNVWDLFRYLYLEPTTLPKPFLSLAMGLIFLGFGIFSSFKTREKIATSLIGIASIAHWLSDIKIVSLLITSPVSIVLNVSAMIVYFKSHRNIQEKTTPTAKKIIIAIAIFLLILLLPAIFFWLLGMTANLTR
ncbi:MAG: hypothetical protein NG740_02660 [Omnitrophica bacterium]|nr:hypothetical protein [Candidatus Omnitrophota bacterium]